MELTGNLRIAVSGFVGTGKTTLCATLGSRLGLTCLVEDMKGIADASAAYTRALATTDYQTARAAKKDLIRAFVEWARARADAYARHNRLIADRWEADLLTWWMMCFAFRSGGVDEITKRLIIDLQKKSRLFDYLVLMPLAKPFGETGSRNDDGLLRKYDLTTHILDFSTTFGIIHNFAKSNIIKVPVSLNSVQERADYIMAAIADSPPSGQVDTASRLHAPDEHGADALDLGSRGAPAGS